MKRQFLLAAVACCTSAVAIVQAQQGLADRRAAEVAIMNADRNFNRAMADRDLNRFLSFVAEDALFDANRGREAVGKAWAAFFGAGGPTITWTPTKAEVLVAGDVGYTVGTWERHARAADGTTKMTRGQYVTVWRKQQDGSWQAAFDVGSTAP
jgi:ketosteroid isomerase-like protein